MTNPTVVDVLHRMKRLLRKGWTQGARARNKSRRKVDVYSKSAASFCLDGAASRASVDLGGYQRLANRARKVLWKACGNRSVICFNDEPDRTKRQILAVVERAVELAG